MEEQNTLLTYKVLILAAIPVLWQVLKLWKNRLFPNGVFYVVGRLIGQAREGAKRTSRKSA